MNKLFSTIAFIFAGVFAFVGAPAQAQTVVYGVDIDEATGDVSGYAWSDAVGWIDFNNVSYNTATGELSGNADITGITSQGANGQLSLQGDCTPSCGGYAVVIDSVTRVFSGYGWNDVIGWVWFENEFSDATHDPNEDPSVAGYAWNDNIGWISLSSRAEVPPADTCSASPHNTCLWAWSDTIGWITHNSVDNPSSPKYGVHIDESTGAVSGYAWSDSGGWINFAPTAGFPEAPSSGAQYNAATGELSGWAWMESFGNNGWIKLRDAGAVPYGVTVSSNGDFSGYAWSDTFGWFEFAPSGYAPVHHDPDLNPSVSGWAWNDSLGWISLAFTGFDVEYGVDVEADGRITGYAWSEIGWIQYDPAGPYPSAPNYASRWDPVTEDVSGWARAVGMTGSWAGTSWIKMRSSAGDTVNYGVRISRATGLWSGHAWNDTFGWIQYQHAFGAVYTKFSSTGPSTPVLVEPLNCVDTYTLQPASPLTPTLDWSDYVALDSSTQAAFQIQLDDDPLFGSPVFDETVNSTASNYSVGLGQLTYNVAYYWRVRVQSSNGDWSEWGITGTLGTETNCLRTPVHPAPVCDFTMTPPTPAVGVETLFTDTTQLFGGASVSQWNWTFGDGQSLSGSDPDVHKNPTHTYNAVGNITIILGVTDSDGYSCSESRPMAVQQVLPEFERVIPR